MNQNTSYRTFDPAYEDKLANSIAEKLIAVKGKNYGCYMWVAIIYFIFLILMILVMFWVYGITWETASNISSILSIVTALILCFVYVWRFRSKFCSKWC